MRILTGLQPSGKLHLGNYFSAIRKMLEYQSNNELFLFIANLHSLTTLKDPNLQKSNTYNAVLDLLALGIDPNKTVFWVQSDVPEVTEVTWYLSMAITTSQLSLAHSFKDKTAKGFTPSAGLFNYPILMAADIPVYKNLFVHGYWLGWGDVKMSKSLGNVIEPDKLIDIFGSDATRYLLFSFFSFGEDCDISLSKFYDEYNAKLANGYGNLISRTLTLALGKGEIKLKKVDKKFEKKVSACWRDYDASMEGLKFNQALEVFQALIAFCNEYIDKK